MYIQKIYRMKHSIDVEKYHSGRYGAPGEKRKSKKKATAEDIKKQNYEQAKRNLKRLINANFSAGDFHCTLTYKKENRPDQEEARRELANFLRRVGRAYKKTGNEFKYIVVTEYESKSIHHHIILNNIPGATDLINKNWKVGRVHFTPLDYEGDYKNLAEYLLKETEKTFRESDSANKKRYTRSRNLLIPEPEKKLIKASTFRKKPQPIKGYYIDPESFHEGINPVTGYLYQTYTMIRLERYG